MKTENIYDVYTLNGENIKVVDRYMINNDLNKVIEFIKFIYEIFSENGKEDNADCKYMVDSVKTHTETDFESNSGFDKEYVINGRYVNVTLFYDSKLNREYYSLAIQTDLRNNTIKKTLNFMNYVVYFEKQKRIVIFQKDQIECILKNISYNQNEEAKRGKSNKSFVNIINDVTEQNFFNLETDVFELSKELAELKKEVKKVYDACHGDNKLFESRFEKIEEEVQRIKKHNTQQTHQKDESKNYKDSGYYKLLCDMFDEKYVDRIFCDLFAVK